MMGDLARHEKEHRDNCEGFIHDFGNAVLIELVTGGKQRSKFATMLRSFDEDFEAIIEEQMRVSVNNLFYLFYNICSDVFYLKNAFNNK